MSFHKAAQAVREFCAFDIKPNFFEKIDSSYQSRILNADCVHQLKLDRSLLPIVYIDGGNQFLIKSSALCIALIRIANCVFEKNQYKSKKYDFFVIARMQEKKIKLEYSSLEGEIDFLQYLPTEISQNDEVLKTAEQPLMKAISHIRKIAELESARIAAIEHKNSLIVWDGALLSPHIHKVVAKILPLATIISVSKTTGLLTTSGFPVAMYIAKLTDFDSYYTDALLIDFIGVHFAKLHPKSEFILRIDAPQCDYAKVFGVLASQSADITAKGYPYGLLKADEAARVTNEEVLYFKTRLIQQLDSLTVRQLRLLEHTADTHELLDSLKF